jgi:hypothetical protein
MEKKKIFVIFSILVLVLGIAAIFANANRNSAGDIGVATVQKNQKAATLRLWRPHINCFNWCLAALSIL